MFLTSACSFTGTWRNTFSVNRRENKQVKITVCFTMIYIFYSKNKKMIKTDYATSGGASVRALLQLHTRGRSGTASAVSNWRAKKQKTICFWIIIYIYSSKMPDLAVERVVVHPLVLLSVVDHFNRYIWVLWLCCRKIVNSLSLCVNETSRYKLMGNRRLRILN